MVVRGVAPAGVVVQVDKLVVLAEMVDWVEAVGCNTPNILSRLGSPTSTCQPSLSCGCSTMVGMGVEAMPVARMVAKAVMGEGVELMVVEANREEVRAMVVRLVARKAGRLGAVVTGAEVMAK